MILRNNLSNNLVFMFYFAIFADVSLIVVDLLTELWYLLHKKMKWNGMVSWTVIPSFCFEQFQDTRWNFVV